MKLTFISFIAILLFFSQDLRAQDSYEDVVYLKNGSVFRGWIFEQVPGKSVTIQSSDRGIFTFTYEEIEKIRKEPRESVASYSSNERFAPVPTFNILQAGLLTGRGDRLATYSIVHDVQVDDRVAFGIGAGYDVYGTSTMIPLFLDARMYLVDGLVSPFLFSEAGYSLARVKGKTLLDAGGFVLNAGAGFIGRAASGASVIFQVSYHFQRTKALEPDYAYEFNPFGYQVVQTSHEIMVNREFVAITVGFGF